MLQKQFKDHLQRSVTLNHPPQRIISLVPSLTELLFDLGLGERVVGVTKFCIHPEAARKQCVIIGGTKNFRFDEIDRLKPDLIIANKEENYQDGIVELVQRGWPVWVSDIADYADAVLAIRDIGELTGAENQAAVLINTIESGFSMLDGMDKPKAGVVYLIWNNPMMTVGKDTFIHHILKTAGFENVFGGRERYPEITEADIRNARPDYIFLSSEPFPFKEQHVQDFSERFPDSEVFIVDGEMFSWYGSRMQKVPEYIRKLRAALPIKK